jgi:hypothetical protein
MSKLRLVSQPHPPLTFNPGWTSQAEAVGEFAEV